MHRDTKLGLALGILLVGIVGAFFFRNENVRRDVAPALADPQSLDEQIAEKSVAPYLMAPEFGEASPTSVEADPVSALDSDRAWELPEFLKDDSGRIPPGRESGRPGPPDPILTDRGDSDPIVVRRNTSPDVSRLPVPDHNKAWEVSTVGLSQGSSKLAPVDGTVEYRVRQGDTLSGLAGKHLGSTARFRDLYELNRDVLRSPDGLRAGITIRLPIAGRNPVPPTGSKVQTVGDSAPKEMPELDPLGDNTTADAAAPTPAGNEPAAAEPAEKRAEKPKLFSPVRRPPLSASGAATSRTQDTNSPVKSLSQVPPDAAVGEPVQN